MKKGILFILSLFTFSLLSSSGYAQKSKKMENNQYEQITLGAGCFWCVEAVFQRVNGVVKVESGYANGQVPNPSYRDVCTGMTGYAEVAQLTYDPKVVTFKEILEVFWHTHNPTTLNQQGADKGTQYRSGIYYHNEEQKAIAEASLKKTDASGLWDKPIVTEIRPLSNYYVAEDYHQNYYNTNKNQPYCSIVIVPKLKKLESEFPNLLKEK
ncbi:peptide-methionine (S)-S-oxide reductase MsrA [Algivirga pacifica]|uniref:Peptide methionine sulfoxide reductase MsrA n=1 Tax=Algivirga pacifica TaxID=1162670 RepID=A0ABP9D1B3_9BACT